MARPEHINLTITYAHETAVFLCAKELGKEEEFYPGLCPAATSDDNDITVRSST